MFKIGDLVKCNNNLGVEQYLILNWVYEIEGVEQHGNCVCLKGVKAFFSFDIGRFTLVKAGVYAPNPFLAASGTAGTGPLTGGRGSAVSSQGFISNGAPDLRNRESLDAVANEFPIEYLKVKYITCECGCTAVGSSNHSDYCPLYLKA